MTKGRVEVGAQHRVTDGPLGSDGFDPMSGDPRMLRARQAHCPAPHPKPSLRFAFDLSPAKSGER
jgi:hypothetical protein